MYISIRLRYLVLYVFVLICGKIVAVQEPDAINHRVVDSVKNAMNREKISIHEKTGILFHLGITYNSAGKYDSARICFNQALNLPGGKEFEGGRILSNLANSFGFDGQYPEALEYYLEALETGERLEIKGKTATDRTHGQWNVVRAMANAAEIYYLMGNQEQALYYAEKARNKIDATGTGDSYMSPQIYYVIASVYLTRGILDKAEEYMTKTYDIADRMCKTYIQQNGNPRGNLMYCSYGKEGLARVYLSRKEYDKAKKYAEEALDFAGQHGDPMTVAKVLSAFSDIYMAQEDYAESGRFATEAMKKSPEYLKLNPDIAFNIAVANLFAGDKEKAYGFLRIYSGQMKKNTDRQFRETMVSMEIQFETEKKELRISNLERQKILYISVGISAILFAVAIWIILRQKIKNEQKEKQLVAANAVFEGEKRERERFVRNLHDGVNGMLSAIRIELAATEHLQGIRDRIDGCIEEIRRLASGMMPVSLQRYGIKAALEDYCRSFPNVHFHFFGENKRIDEKIELAVYYCAYELVFNSVKHSGATNVNVQLIQENDRISLTVQDDGCGYDGKSSGQGVGLRSLRDRITALNGKLEIASSPENGTETTIEIQLRIRNSITN